MKIKATNVRITRVVIEHDDAGLKIVPTPRVRIELLCDGVVISYYDIPESLVDTVDLRQVLETGGPHEIGSISLSKVLGR